MFCIEEYHAIFPHSHQFCQLEFRPRLPSVIPESINADHHAFLIWELKLKSTMKTMCILEKGYGENWSLP